MITANSDWSTRRRRSSSDGKNGPARSFSDPQLQITGRGADRPRPVSGFLGGIACG